MHIQLENLKICLKAQQHYLLFLVITRNNNILKYFNQHERYLMETRLTKLCWLPI